MEALVFPEKYSWSSPTKWSKLKRRGVPEAIEHSNLLSKILPIHQTLVPKFDNLSSGTLPLLPLLNKWKCMRQKYIERFMTVLPRWALCFPWLVDQIFSPLLEYSNPKWRATSISFRPWTLLMLSFGSSYLLYIYLFYYSLPKLGYLPSLHLVE